MSEKITLEKVIAELNQDLYLPKDKRQHLYVDEDMIEDIALLLNNQQVIQLLLAKLLHNFYTRPTSTMIYQERLYKRTSKSFKQILNNHFTEIYEIIEFGKSESLISLNDADSQFFERVSNYWSLINFQEYFKLDDLSKEIIQKNCMNKKILESLGKDSEDEKDYLSFSTVIDNISKLFPIYDPSIIAQALEKVKSTLLGNIINEKTAAAMIQILENSNYAMVYACYVLSDNSAEYKREFLPNIKLEKELLSSGINIDVYHNGITDLGITIELLNGNKKTLMNDLLSLKTKELLDESVNIYKKIRKIWSSSKDSGISDITNAEYITIVNELHSCSNNSDNLDRLSSYLFSSIEENQQEAPEGITQDKLKRFMEIIPFIKFEIKLDEDNLRKIIEQKSEIKIQYNLTLLIAYQLKSILHEYGNEVRCEIDNYKNDKTSFGTEELLDLRKSRQLYNDGILVLSHLKTHIAKLLFEDYQELSDEFNTETIGEGGFVKDRIPQKLKTKNSVNYFVKKETLLPTDVLFGNDGGCCIGIYDSGSNGINSVPVYQLYNGIHIFGIYQSADTQKTRRVGMVLSFTILDEKERMTLCHNSIELSEKSNPTTVAALKQITEHTLNYLINYQIESGMPSEIIMGSHNYNTSMNYMPIHFKKEVISAILKLPIPEIRSHCFYSEVLDNNKVKNNSVIRLVNNLK